MQTQSMLQELVVHKGTVFPTEIEESSTVM